MSDIKLICKAESEWYWRKSNGKMLGPFASEYAATKDARVANDHDERRNYPRETATERGS